MEKRSLPDLELFYFSPWIAADLFSELRSQWLGDSILYIIDLVAGAIGLQFLVVGCLLIACWSLRKLCFPSYSPWLILLFLCVALSTYQLQLVRNSLFSLALYPLVLAMGMRRTTPPNAKEYFQLGVVLLLWSCLHASFLLGWLTAFVLFGWRAFASFFPRSQNKDKKFAICRARESLAFFFKREEREKFLRSFRFDRESGQKNVFYAVVFFSVFFLVGTVGRQATSSSDFVSVSLKNIALLVIPEIREKRDSVPIPSPAQTSPSREETVDAASSVAIPPPLNVEAKSLKQKLNSLVWQPDPSIPWSNDFWSPLDMLPGMRPIEVAAFLVLLAALCLLVFCNQSLGVCVAWLGALLLGAGYIRMFGYAGLFSAAVIVSSIGSSKFFLNARFRVLTVIGWGLVGCWIVFAWVCFFGGKWERVIPEGQHVSHIGKVNIYDDDVCLWVKSEFGQEKVFTTIESGSYCLYLWDFEKPVFVDGFFAAHTKEAWASYHAALRGGNPSVLFEEQKITAAIIPVTSQPWLYRFLTSPDWYAGAIGKGCVVFLHRSISKEGRKPAVFLKAEDLKKTSAYYRYHALRVAFLVAANQKESGFLPQEWLAHPEFVGLREMAKEVFPKKAEIERSVLSDPQ